MSILKSYTSASMRNTSTLLKRYSASAIAFITGSIADGQVVYENIDPDIFMDEPFEQHVDFNDDGQVDISFRVWQTSESTYSYYAGWSFFSRVLYVSAYNFDAVVGSAVFPDNFNIKKLQIGDEIDATNFWNDAESVGIDQFISSDNGYYGVMGGWISSDDFIGVRFQIAGETHYGWVRLAMDNFSLSADNFPQVCVLETGYELEANTPITIAPNAVDIAKNVTIRDVGESGTISDLQVSFDAAHDESAISEYRIFLHPGYTFPLETAAGLSSRSSEFYQSVTPGLAHYDVTLTSFKDLFGAVLHDNVYYTPIILSVPNGTGAPEYNISLPGNREDARIESAAYVNYVYGSQVDYSYTAADFKATFGIDYGLEFTDHYRVYILDNTEVTMEELLSLPDSYYMTVPEDGAFTHQVTFASDKLIYASSAPVLFHRYHFAVISMPDVTIASQPRMRLSNADYAYYVDYFNPEFPTIPTVQLIDTTETAADIQVECEKVDPENTIKFYKIFIVPDAEAEYFDADLAEPLMSENIGYKVYPNGNDLHIRLPENQLDIHQNTLIPSELYRIFVVLYTEHNYLITSVSQPSLPFKLEQARSIFPTIFAVGNEIQINLPTDLSLPFHILAMDGRLIYSGITAGQETKVTLSPVSTGLYIIQFPNTEIQSQSFFIKE